MADDLEEELDYGYSPDPKPARAKGTAGQAGATPKDEGIGAEDDIYGDLFAPAAPSAPAVGAGGGAPPPGSIAALEADEVRRRGGARDPRFCARRVLFFLNLLPISHSLSAPPPRRRPGRGPGRPAGRGGRAKGRGKRKRKSFCSAAVAPFSISTSSPLHPFPSISFSLSARPGSENAPPC